MAKKKENPFVAIPASMGGILIAMIVLFLLFAKDQLIVLSYLTVAYVVLGIAALFFAYKNEQKN